MDISPGAVMWSPEKHPEWNTMVDIGQTDGAKVLVTADDLFPQYLVGTGILRANQLDTSYDGSPTNFVQSGGTIAQGGFATNEPYVYSKELPDWGRPIAFQLVHDTGFEVYTQTLSIRRGRKGPAGPLPAQVRHLMQRSVVEFITSTPTSRRRATSRRATGRQRPGPRPPAGPQGRALPRAQSVAGRGAEFRRAMEDYQAAVHRWPAR